MDRIDRRIISYLANNARLTYAEIGQRVSLAPSSVHERVRKLERSGVVRGYRADVSLEAAGMPITAFVSLELRPSSPPDIPVLASELPLVEACYSVAGDHSYVLLVRAPSTRALEELLDTLRAKLDVTTRSTVVLSTAFERRNVLERLEDPAPPQT